MKTPNQHRPSYPGHKKAIFGMVVVFFFTLLISHTLLIKRQQKQLLKEKTTHTRFELEEAAAFMVEPLLKYQFSNIDQFIQKWSQSHKDVLHFEAISPTGHLLSSFSRQPETSASPITVHTEVSHLGESLLTLSITKDFSREERLLHESRQYLFVISALITFALGIILWFVFRIFALRPLEQEITQRSQAEQELEKTTLYLEKSINKRTQELRTKNRALRVLRELSQDLYKAEDELELLEEACRILVEEGDYLLAWVGYAEENEDKTVKAVAQNGFHDNYLETITIRWDDSEYGQGPTGKAIRTRSPVISQHILSDQNFTPWREAAGKRGYQSSIALPLFDDENCFGSINIYSKEPDSFSGAEVELLGEFGADLSYGITALRSRFARQIAEKGRELEEDRLQSLLILHEKRTLPENKLCAYALEEAVRLTDSTCGYLHFFDADEETISLNLWSKGTQALCSAEKMAHYPLENAGIWADCVRLRKTVTHNDFPNHPDKKGYPEGHFPVLRHMSVPIFDNNKIVAIIGVGNKEAPYNDAENRQLTLFFASTWDIIKQKRHEEEKKNITLQLQQAQKMEALGSLAGGIAHDFNNILGVIFASAGMAKGDVPPGSKISDNLERILKASYRAEDLVQQILAFSRRSQIERVSLKAQPLIKETLKMLRASMPTTIAIQQEILPDCGAIDADPTQLHQILMNLCTNAFHAMEEKGGTLKVELKPADSIPLELTQEKSRAADAFIELAISDTGHGVGADIIDRIFDPFFTTKEEGKGTGMGLAISYGIVKEFGGTITVDSQLGQGTTFHVFLPRSRQEVIPTPSAKADLPKGTERILFVDDEELLADSGKDMLERLGYRVTVSRKGSEALKAFLAQPEAFDLVITDQTMPGMTGLDLAKQMLQVRADLPIILCTGYSNLVNEDVARAAGIKKFVLKPLPQSNLAKLIRQILDQGQDSL